MLKPVAPRQCAGVSIRRAAAVDSSYNLPSRAGPRSSYGPARWRVRVRAVPPRCRGEAVMARRHDGGAGTDAISGTHRAGVRSRASGDSRASDSRRLERHLRRRRQSHGHHFHVAPEIGRRAFAPQIHRNRSQVRLPIRRAGDTNVASPEAGAERAVSFDAPSADSTSIAS
jgi:hypothetical protein